MVPSKIQVLFMRLALPSSNIEHVQDLLNLPTDFGLGHVANQFGWNTSGCNVVHEGAGKVSGRLHAIDVSKDFLYRCRFERRSLLHQWWECWSR